MTELLQPRPAGCTLTHDGLRTQRERVALVRAAVENVEHVPGSLRLVFGADVDAAVLRELVETERRCCSFLTIDYDDVERVIRVSSDDRPDVVAGFAAVFGGSDA